MTPVDSMDVEKIGEAVFSRNGTGVDDRNVKTTDKKLSAQWWGKFYSR